ncbi:ras-related protein Rab-40C [Suricata suricatta]|nr:ras-related protein Rab-40C [Suricata suricatta]
MKSAFVGAARLTGDCDLAASGLVAAGAPPGRSRGGSAQTGAVEGAGGGGEDVGAGVSVPRRRRAREQVARGGRAAPVTQRRCRVLGGHTPLSTLVVARPKHGADPRPDQGIDYKTTTILLDGRRVKLELWDTSGQGRFCTIFRSYSRGAQGILLVYDITNRWSFDGIDRWIKEIDEHAPGVPRILVGNRLHLAFKRQVPTEQARAYAEKNGMTFFEVSPLCNFNVIESFTELSRIVLMRHGMEKIWRPNRVFSLQDLCCRAIVSCTPVHLIDKLPLPVTIKSHLKSFSMANGMNAVMMHGRSYSLASGAAGGSTKGNSLKRSKSIRPPQSPPQNCSRSNCKIS